MRKIIAGILIIAAVVLVWWFWPAKTVAPVLPANADIIVGNPTPNALVTSPFTLMGKARGNWYFEASFPATLLDSNGKVLAQLPVQATGDWMTTEFVPFSASIAFAKPETATGMLILKNDNPSGDPAKEKSISIPVRFQ